tara:strand:- start:753 stop:908 length:156 start_codon:yes stop_codon:yes gene_type:complete
VDVLIVGDIIDIIKRGVVVCAECVVRGDVKYVWDYVRDIGENILQIIYFNN